MSHTDAQYNFEEIAPYMTDLKQDFWPGETVEQLTLLLPGLLTDDEKIWVVMGGHVWEASLFQGPKGGNPLQKTNIFLLFWILC